MRKNGLSTVVLLVAFGLMRAVHPAFASDADEQSASELTAQWWQWVSSIPRTVNPVGDSNGKDCAVGQRGDVWFLGGTFTNGPVTRTCSVPEGKALFFPVINYVSVYTAGKCGSDPFSVKVMRAVNASYIDAATTVSVTLDGHPFKNIDRVRSKVFELTMPEDNWATSFFPCAAGIYSPAVDDGYYARVEALSPGSHELRIRAEAPSKGLSQDVTYHLNVVPVRLK